MSKPIEGGVMCKCGWKDSAYDSWTSIWSRVLGTCQTAYRIIHSPERCVVRKFVVEYVDSPLTKNDYFGQKLPYDETFGWHEPIERRVSPVVPQR
jgi:hypothetical protein